MVGAGPAGIVVALDLARNGIDVVLIESGGRRSIVPGLPDGDILSSSLERWLLRRTSARSTARRSRAIRGSAS
jgi:flavin-dependent dehydrogenase